jgi:hypothetical protein
LYLTSSAVIAWSTDHAKTSSHLLSVWRQAWIRKSLCRARLIKETGLNAWILSSASSSFFSHHGNERGLGARIVADSAGTHAYHVSEPPDRLHNVYQWLRTPYPEKFLSLEVKPGHLRLYGMESPGSLYEQAMIAISPGRTSAQREPLKRPCCYSADLQYSST